MRSRRVFSNYSKCKIFNISSNFTDCLQPCDFELPVVDPQNMVVARICDTKLFGRRTNSSMWGQGTGSEILAAILLGDMLSLECG